MTNYDILKEYEAHQIPVPSYDEWVGLNRICVKYEKENAELKEVLKECKDFLPEFETPMNILAKIDEVLK